MQKGQSYFCKHVYAILSVINNTKSNVQDCTLCVQHEPFIPECLRTEFDLASRRTNNTELSFTSIRTLTDAPQISLDTALATTKPLKVGLLHHKPMLADMLQFTHIRVGFVEIKPAVPLNQSTAPQ